MSGAHIHPTAIVEEGAQLGVDCTVEAYAIVKANVTLGDRVTIKAHAYIDGHTSIGSNSTIYPFASIGTKSQDHKHTGEISYVEIGEHAEIREYVTINAACGAGLKTRIGHHAMIMAYGHVGHNCSVGDHVTIANGVALAGHVEVGDRVIIGGHTPVHQFTRIGSYAMVGGFSRVKYDIPPFTIGAGMDVYKLGGLNLIGLKRQGFDLPVRQALSRAFRTTFRQGLHLDDALRIIEEEVELTEEVRYWIDFCRSSKRGLSGFKAISKETAATVA